MSDNGLTTDAVPAGVPDAPPPAATPPASAPADPFADLPTDRAVFDRGYVESLRTEGAKYRTDARAAQEQLGTYDQVFGAYPDEDRQVWFDLARTWANDPAQAAAVMKEIAMSVLGDEGSNGEATPPPPATPQTLDQVIDELTPDKVKALIDESLSARDAKTAEQRAINDVFAEVRAAGYDPDTAEGFSVLYNANHYTGGDITKAVEMQKQYEQKIIDNYVQGRSSGRSAVPSPSAGFVANSVGEPIKSIEDARSATEAFLRERQAAR